jgi:DNA topoisomerase-1
MMVAQKLYEGIQLSKHGLQGLITYMRTDSVRTEPEALDSVRTYIQDKYGKDFLPPEAIIYKKKKGAGKTQDAHEAIRPTNLELHPDTVEGDLSPDEHKLYSLIWNKFISSQMASAIIDQTTVTLECNGHYFRSTGSIIKFAGFRKVYLEAVAEKILKKGEEVEAKIGSKLLPHLDLEEMLKAQKGPYSEEHWTAPPPRYNEASIVKELEEKGIGRPSTYASIISNIQDRGYVEKVENRFIPTELGSVVCKMLLTSFPNVMDVAFTAKVEDLLDNIEEGQVKWKKVLRDFWLEFEKTLEKAKEEMKNLKHQEIPTGIKCARCEGEYIIKWGKNGQFFACSNYPICNSTQDFKKHLDGTYEIIPKEYAKNPCPSCGNRLVVKTGRYGRFLTCEEYPKCKTTLPYTLDVNCPECKVGEFAEKKSRYGKIFYGCTRYPDCTNAMWTLPRKFDCPSCGYPVMGQRITKRNGEHLECPKCKYKVPIEETPYHDHEDDES